MQRDVSCRIEVDAPGVTDVVLSIAVAAPAAEETLSEVMAVAGTGLPADDLRMPAQLG